MSEAHEARATPEARRLFEITAVLREDAHLGSGSSGPGINGLVARDRRGRPVIWASHLEGLLRDALMLRGERDVAERLFGKSGRIRQPAVFTSLYCSSAAKPSRIWRSTARKSFDNRAPDDDTLRAIELVPKGTTFVGKIDLPDDGDLATMRRLLEGLSAVGHGRSSGAGRVELTLTELDRAPRAPRSFALEPGTTRLRLLLRNLDPMCLAATAMPGNLVPTLPYVPGRTLLGALASWLIDRGLREAAAALLSERLAVSDALPLPWTEPSEVGELEALEVTPAPLALKHRKPEAMSGAVPWWAWQESSPERSFAPDIRYKELDAKTDERVRLKRPEADLFFVRRAGGAWESCRPEVRARLRNGRPDPDQAEPALFAIEHLAEDTCFLAELSGEPEALQELTDALRPVLEGRHWLRVGRAGAPVEIAATSCRGGAAPELVEDGLLTLTSDLLVRDPELRWYTTLRPEDFQHVVGWPAGVEVLLAAQEGAVVRGFNGTARLWRLPIGGIRRGSVFRVKGPGVAALIAAAAEGRWLGERTHEGFGRFRIDSKKKLPGVSTRSAGDSRQLRDGADDDGDEARCKTTRAWLDEHPRLATSGTTEARRPSLSQWMDLVSELEARDEQAIQRRLRADTRGGMVWQDDGARTVLEQLEQLAPVEERAKHARLFVRWLRVELRREEKERP
jgi:hypothetical protein